MSPQNGYVPAELLREVEPGKFLEAATAAAYLRAKADSGGLLKIASPAGAYRDFAVQADMKAHPERYGIDPALAVGLAPAGSSTHGWGTRLDLIVGSARTWAIVHLPDYGFRREYGAADPGHWQFLKPTFAGGGVTPVPPATRLEPDMHISKDETPTYFLVTPNGMYVLPTQALADAANRALGATPTRADLNYLNSLLLGPRWSTAGTVPPVGAVALSESDIAKIVAAIEAAAGEVEAQDPAVIAAAVEAALADDFAAVQGNIDDQPTEFTVSPKG